MRQRYPGTIREVSPGALIHYLALVCDEAAMRQRLMARPDWHDSSSAEFLSRMVAYNQWFCDQANSIPELTLLDTSGRLWNTPVRRSGYGRSPA